MPFLNFRFNSPRGMDLSYKNLGRVKMSNFVFFFWKSVFLFHFKLNSGVLASQDCHWDPCKLLMMKDIGNFVYYYEKSGKIGVLVRKSQDKVQIFECLKSLRTLLILSEIWSNWPEFGIHYSIQMIIINCYLEWLHRSIHMWHLFKIVSTFTSW